MRKHTFWNFNFFGSKVIRSNVCQIWLFFAFLAILRRFKPNNSKTNTRNDFKINIRQWNEILHKIWNFQLNMWKTATLTVISSKLRKKVELKHVSTQKYFMTKLVQHYIQNIVIFQIKHFSSKNWKKLGYNLFGLEIIDVYIEPTLFFCNFLF